MCLEKDNTDKQRKRERDFRYLKRVIAKIQSKS